MTKLTPAQRIAILEKQLTIALSALKYYAGEPVPYPKEQTREQHEMGKLIMDIEAALAGQDPDELSAEAEADRQEEKEAYEAERLKDAKVYAKEYYGEPTQ